MKLKKRPMAAVFGSGFISWPVQFRTICPDLSRLYQTMKQWLMNNDLTDHQHTLASSLAVVLMWTVQTWRWFFFFLSVIVGARLPLPRQQMFGFEVVHVSVRLTLPALTVHVLLWWLHHFLCLLHHLRGKKTKIPVSCFHRNKNYTRDLIFHFPTNQRLPHSSPRLSPLCLVIQTGLVVDGKRSGCGSWKWVELRPRVCVS